MKSCKTLKTQRMTKQSSQFTGSMTELKPEFESKKLMRKLNNYTRWKFNFFIIWQTGFKTQASQCSLHTSFIKAFVVVDKTADIFEVHVNEHDIKVVYPPRP